MPEHIYLFKVNKKKNTQKRCEIFSKLTTRTLEQRQQRRSGVFKVEFEYILIFQYFHIDFEQVNILSI